MDAVVLPGCRPSRLSHIFPGRIAIYARLPKAHEVVMETILDTIVRTLRGGEKVEVRGFGSFRTRPRLARIGRNPKTGARVEVPAKKIPYFIPSKELKAGLAELAARSPK
jgi:nucleoid DNA-binding protein